MRTRNVTTRLKPSHLTLAGLVLIAGCVTSPKPDPVDEWCIKNEPHYFTRAEADSMTTERENFWIAHNEQGEKDCGWQPLTGA
jgi:hypothetical protein